MAPAPYSVIGPYTHGVWLVALKNNAFALMDRAHLPKPSAGIRYYWLGTTVTEVQDRYPGAIGSLHLPLLNVPSASAIQSALNGKVIGISGPSAGQVPGVPGGSSPNYPGAVPPPSPTQVGVPNPVAALADAINGIVDFLKFIAWIFHPVNLLRAVEFLTGIGLMFYGLSVLVKGAVRSSATHRTSVIGGIKSAFSKPEDHVAAGRAAGTRQGERDVAYREARSSVLQGSSNPPKKRTVTSTAKTAAKAAAK